MFPRRFPVNRVHGPPGKNERDKRNKEGSLSSCTATAPSPCLSLMSSIVRGRLRWEWERWAELSLCGPHRDDHHKRLFHRRFSPLNLRRPNNEHQSTTRVVEWTCSLGRPPGAQTCKRCHRIQYKEAKRTLSAPDWNNVCKWCSWICLAGLNPPFYPLFVCKWVNLAWTFYISLFVWSVASVDLFWEKSAGGWSTSITLQ
jgi:hypothetical protein